MNEDFQEGVPFCRYDFVRFVQKNVVLYLVWRVPGFFGKQ